MVGKTPTKLRTSSSAMSESEKASDLSQPIDNYLLTNAVQALVKHHRSTLNKAHENSKTTPLLGSDVPISVLFTLARVPEHTTPKPVTLRIPHPLFRFPKLNSEGNPEDNTDMVDVDDGLGDVEICLIVKDEAKPDIQALIQKFPKHHIMSCIKKVLTLTSLRKKHGRFADRRALLERFDLFMADSRILPMLSKALGQSFFEKKKQPIPVRVTKKESLPNMIEKSLHGTVMIMRPGTCLSIKAGNTGFTTPKLADNIQAVITHAVPRIPRRWANIMSISIKTPNSVSLPIYNKTREELELIADMAKDVEPTNESNDDTNADKKGRKRQRDDGDIENAKNTSLELSKKIQLECGGMGQKTNDMKEKSPLLKALKRQKREEEAKRMIEDSEGKEAKVSKEKLASQQEHAVVENVQSGKNKVSEAGHELSSQSSQKHTKLRKNEEKSARRSSAEMSGQLSRETDTSTKTNIKGSAASNSRQSAKADLKAAELQKSTIVKTNTKSPAVKDSGNEEFLAEAKFMGERKGYVFRSGKRGIGYYIDTPPIPDLQAIKALARAKGASDGTRPKKGRR